MQRIAQPIRPDWRLRLVENGFHFHSIDENGEDQSGRTDKFLYWREDVAYRFTEAQVEQLYAATVELHHMAMDLAGDLITRGDLELLRIPGPVQPLVEASWRRRDPHLHGRFDLSWNGRGDPKLLEANYDTPTSLIESAVAQWWWKQDVQADADQFNSGLEPAWPRHGRDVCARRTGGRLRHRGVPTLAGPYRRRWRQRRGRRHPLVGPLLQPQRPRLPL
jgi:glutathionylspermidine synthase